MPGAWEYRSPEVLVATLTRELVATRWAVGFRNLRLPPSAQTSQYSGAPFDHARNMACQGMLEHNFEWLFFIDDDVIPPPDAFQRLASHGKDIISGLYYRRATPLMPVMLRYNAQGALTWIEQWSPPNALLEVDAVGAGCLLIHRRVLERMRSNWFEWQIDKPVRCKLCDQPALPAPAECPSQPGKPHEPKSTQRLSEDFAFCDRAKKEFGFQIFVDTSVVCEHIGLGQSVGGAFTPSGV